METSKGTDKEIPQKKTRRSVLSFLASRFGPFANGSLFITSDTTFVHREVSNRESDFQLKKKQNYT